MAHMRRSIARTIVFMVASVALAGAPAAVAQTVSPSPATTTTFTWADTAEPSSLNPIVGYAGTDFVLWAINYNLPIEFGTDFSPDYAHSIVTGVDTSADGMAFTYHLRSGMEWSDGQPFTASDVAWTLNFYKRYHIANYLADLQLFRSATATDDTTVVIRTSQPTSLFSGKTVFMYEYILPEHIWGKYENDPRAAKQFSNVPSVGSGPYVITDYERGRSVTLERNPHYWGLSVGLTPHYDKLVYIIYNNEDAEASALQNGEIDFAYFNSPNILESLKGKPDIAVRGGQIPWFDYIGMNTGSAYEQDPAGGFRPHGDGAHALTDPVVRRAIRQAIDDRTIVDKVLQGFGAVADSPVQPDATTGNWDPPPDQALPFDIAAANASLDAAGYRRGSDGVRIDPTTHRPLELRLLLANSDQNAIETAPYLKDWLGQIGIKIDVSTASYGKITTAIEAGTYDLVISYWYPAPDPNYILGIFTCDQRPPRPGVYANDDSYYCNPQYDTLFAKQASTTDAATRASVVHRMQAILYRDAPYAVTYYPQVLEGYRTDRVTGFLAQPRDTTDVKGDLLATFGPFSFINIRPVAGSSAAAGRGGSASLWFVLVFVLVVGAVAVALSRRRRLRDDDTS